MRKALLLPIAVLTAILALSLWNSAAMTACVSQWQAQLQQADALAQSEDWDSVADLLSVSYDGWCARQNYLHIVSRHDVVDDAEAMYCRAMAFAATREPSEFRAEVADLRSQLRLLAEMERFSMKNVL